MNNPIESLYERLNQEAKASGYNLNPDPEFTKDLIQGLLINETKYGYRACPCRLASGNKSKDLDIICPCDYRDADLNQYSICYCALYVSEAVLKGVKKITSIPERRPPEDKRNKPPTQTKNLGSLTQPVWRCKVCGYLCAKESPPGVCPICKAQKERFEKFI